ncbi:putative oligopeptide transporter [Phakopsora pachyrhizi]|uniref:Oligopeptide transporter n=1 Tax=Phakopsora pachyrhizi TaxID=170000 RepID=A0AAV0BGU2_PHAPC|nr:putative oligopeptide transporter [Phakopsora pachyrhizi]
MAINHPNPTSRVNEKDTNSTSSSCLAQTLNGKEISTLACLEKLPATPNHKYSEKTEIPISPFEKKNQDEQKIEQASGSKDISSNKNTSDPFDETAVLPEVVTDDDPNMPTMTLRSILTGVIMTGFGGGVSQLFMYKPVHLHLHPLFIQLACLIIGKTFAAIPGPKWWNPCPMTVKEVVFSSIMATAGAAGTLSVETIAAQDLFFNKKFDAILILSTLMSSQLLGYTWASVLRPLLVYPSKTIFPSVLPSVALFNSMCGDTPEAFVGISLYEVIPTYVSPALQAISPWCLTLPQVPAITQLFGGSMVAEGMGLLSFCLDWTIVDGKNLPFISFDLLDDTGKKYNLTTAVYPNGTEVVEGVEALGLPRYATTFVLGKAGISLALSSAISGAILYNWPVLKAIFQKSDKNELEDPHRTITKNYKEFPNYGFAILAAITITLAFLSNYFGESGLSPGGLAVAFFISALLSLAAGFFYGTVGIHLHCHGIFFPGNAIANLWFAMYGSTTVSQCTFMLKDLKLGQYMHLVLGAITHWQVMESIVGSQREVLLLPHGNGVFTGMHLSSLSAQATSWGIFSQRLYYVGARYSIIPLCLLFGFFLPLPFFLLHIWKPSVGWDRFNISLFCSSIFHAILGVTSGRTTAVILAIFTQYYLRKYRFQWYQKYNWREGQNKRFFTNCLSLQLDGGTQMAVFVLSFALQGGAGFKVDMPTYFLNPKGTRDYCYLPTAHK